jgi:hypothetical protein
MERRPLQARAAVQPRLPLGRGEQLALQGVDRRQLPEFTERVPQLFVRPLIRRQTPLREAGQMLLFAEETSR